MGLATTALKARVAVPLPLEFTAVTVTVVGPYVATGVPVTTQPLSTLNPEGKVPEVTEQVLIGPPDEMTECEITWPTVSTTDDGLYPIIGFATTALSVSTAVSMPLAFIAVTTIDTGPNVPVGIPVTTQTLSRLNPDGRLPDVTEQEVIGPPDEITA